MGTFRICAAIVLLGCGSSEPTEFDAPPAQLDAPTECPQDAAPPVCDVFLSCGCGVDEKCAPGDEGLSCAPAGDGQVGDSCETDDECSPATICLTYGGSTVCHRFCDALHPCPTDEACYVGVNDRGTPPQVVATICGPTCTLLDQDCQIEGQACYPSADVYPVAEKGTCRLTGPGLQGTECDTSSDCAAGFVCVTPSGSSTSICAKLCDREDNVPACEAQTDCSELAGHTRTGICLP